MLEKGKGAALEMADTIDYFHCHTNKNKTETNKKKCSYRR